MSHAGYCLLAAWMILCSAVAGQPGTATADAEERSSAEAPDEPSDELSSKLGAFLPLICTADQTGGFHDYPDDEESYVAALFNATPFRLDENVVFMTNLPEQAGVDLFVTFTAGEDPVTSELECRQVRGVDGSLGYSCVNIPPSELLLINSETLRFTRTSVGGWTFAGANETQSGDSIFVEYGTCTAAPIPDKPQE